MGLAFEEFELTESAYRHGYDDIDVAEVLRRRHLLCAVAEAVLPVTRFSAEMLPELISLWPHA